MTAHSEETAGGSRVVPAWMFNHVWNELLAHKRVDRDFMDRLAPDPKIKRSSAVFAILERLPEVTVLQQPSLVLGLTGKTGRGRGRCSPSRNRQRTALSLFRLRNKPVCATP